MSFIPPTSVILYRNHTNLSLTGTTTETSVGSFTLKGGTLGLNDGLRFEIICNATSNVNLKTFRAKIGSSAAMAVANSSFGSLCRPTYWTNRNSLSSQVAANSAVSSGCGTSTSAAFTSSENTANDLTVSFTVELANSGDTGTFTSIIVYHVRKLIN